MTPIPRDEARARLLAYLAAALPGHNASYIDVPNMDLGDIAMPVVDHDTRVTRYYPNARFRLHEGKPVIVMENGWLSPVSQVPYWQLARDGWNGTGTFPAGGPDRWRSWFFPGNTPRDHFCHYPDCSAWSQLKSAQRPVDQTVARTAAG